MEVGHYGQVFTPADTVKEMVSLRENTGAILEPSAGCGNFVYAIEDFFGHPDSCAVELDNRQATEDMQNIDFFDFAPANKFSTIIGNPPYVHFQDILDTTKSKLDMGLFDSRSNLNLFFIKKCVDLLDDGGELIFIVPRDFLKATSAARLNHWLHQSGTFTYMHDLGEERVFPGFSPECVIFRFVKGDLSHITEYVSADGIRSTRRQVEASGQFLFVENDYTVPFSSLFTVKVGAVSGANHIFVAEHGNIEVVGSFTAKTGDLKRMYHGAAAKSALLPYKEELLSRKIRKFGEDNWWCYGREFYMSDEERIYVNMKTRNTRPFFYNSCKYFDGTVLALFPTLALGEMSPQEMQQLVAELNDVDWHELGFVSGGRFLFGHHSLANVLLPASFGKWIKS